MEGCFARRLTREEEDEEDDLGTSSSSSSSSSSFGDDDDDGGDSAASPAVDRRDDPYEMSSLVTELPFKRGLSRHFQGKSQSFTCLSAARCLEDLAKPDRPQKKKMKPCRSYAGGLDGHGPRSPKASISKKPPSRGGAAMPSLLVRRQSFGGAARPHHRSGSFSASHPLLFA